MDEKIINKLEREDRIEFRQRLILFKQDLILEQGKFYALCIVLLPLCFLLPILGIISLLVLGFYELIILKKNRIRKLNSIIDDYMEIEIKPKIKKNNKEVRKK